MSLFCNARPILGLEKLPQAFHFFQTTTCGTAGQLRQQRFKDIKSGFVTSTFKILAKPFDPIGVAGIILLFNMGFYVKPDKSPRRRQQDAERRGS